jgi:hypothetical protein
LDAPTLIQGTALLDTVSEEERKKERKKERKEGGRQRKEGWKNEWVDKE